MTFQEDAASAFMDPLFAAKPQELHALGAKLIAKFLLCSLVVVGNLISLNFTVHL